MQEAYLKQKFSEDSLDELPVLFRAISVFQNLRVVELGVIEDNTAPTSKTEDSF